jgi:predicted outer membrane lipoprotein
VKFQEAPVSLSVTILIIAALISLPGGLFAAALVSQPRARWLGLIGGVIGAALTAVALEYFTHAAGVTIDAVSWFLGAFLACSMGVAVAALLVNFFTSAGRGSDVRAQEP